MIKRTMISIILLFTAWQVAVSQCKIENTFFQNGEVLVYDMYFKLGFVTTKAGKLSLSVSEGKIKGKGEHKMTFQTNTSGMANGIYSVHDTLYAYMTKDLQPIAYMKNAMESDSYTKEELYYTHKADGKVDIQTKRHKNGTFRFDEKMTSDVCIYDMVSVVYYARTLNFAGMKKGDKTSINFISGRTMSSVDIEYHGEKRIKGNDGKNYNCIELALNFVVGGGSHKSKEMMKVYVSNDKNRIPIQIDTNLKKMGSVKGMIKSYSGLKNVD